VLLLGKRGIRENNRRWELGQSWVAFVKFSCLKNSAGDVGDMVGRRLD